MPEREESQLTLNAAVEDALGALGIVTSVVNNGLSNKIVDRVRQFTRDHNNMLSKYPSHELVNIRKADLSKLGLITYPESNLGENQLFLIIFGAEGFITGLGRSNPIRVNLAKKGGDTPKFSYISKPIAEIPFGTDNVNVKTGNYIEYFSINPDQRVILPLRDI